LRSQEEYRTAFSRNQIGWLEKEFLRENYISRYCRIQDRIATQGSGLASLIINILFAEIIHVRFIDRRILHFCYLKISL